MPQRERQTKQGRGFLVKADAATGQVTAIFSVFGVIDDGLDVVLNGAFKKTLTEHIRRLKVLDHHRTESTEDVIATVVSAREVSREELPVETLSEYPEATGGCEVTMQFLMDTVKGRETFIRIQAGAIDEYSFGFEALTTRYGKQVDPKTGKDVVVRYLAEIKLWEVSPVIWGMNPATATAGVKDGVKEVTPDGEKVARLGDVLIGNLYDIFNRKSASWLIDGFIDGKEHLALLMLMSQAAAVLTAGLDENLALRPLPSYGFDDFWMWFNNDPSSLQKMARRITDKKAGRVLSEQNLNHLRAAMTGIQSVLDAAGAIEMDAGTPENGETTSDADDRAAANDNSGATLSTDGDADPGVGNEAGLSAASNKPNAEAKAGPDGLASPTPTNAGDAHLEAKRRRVQLLAQLERQAI